MEQTKIHSDKIELSVIFGTKCWVQEFGILPWKLVHQNSQIGVGYFNFISPVFAWFPPNLAKYQIIVFTMTLCHHISKSNSYWSVNTCKRRKKGKKLYFSGNFFAFFPLLHVYTHQYVLLLIIWWHIIILKTSTWYLAKFRGYRSKTVEMKIK